MSNMTQQEALEEIKRLKQYIADLEFKEKKYSREELFTTAPSGVYVDECDNCIIVIGIDDGCDTCWPNQVLFQLTDGKCEPLYRGDDSDINSYVLTDKKYNIKIEE